MWKDHQHVKARHRQWPKQINGSKPKSKLILGYETNRKTPKKIQES